MGPSFKEGLKCLKLSVKLAKKIFPECDFAICYNQINSETLQQLKTLNVELFDSEKFTESFFIKPEYGQNVHWKLYPPRLKLNAHELFLDNDVILFKRPKEINDFFNSNIAVMLEGIVYENHGQFNEITPRGLKINSGIFGLPPNFDINKKASQLCRENGINKWEHRMDEQGMVATTIASSKQYEIISNVVVPIIEPDFEIDYLTTSQCCGYHFVQLNYKKHNAWKNFMNNKCLI